jgi:hypothetical protein
MSLSSLFPLALVALLSSSAAAQSLNVAVLGADEASAIADVEFTLQSDSRIATTTSIDVINTTPSIATLDAYDVVVVWNKPPFVFNDLDLLGSHLAAYHTNGGGVVECFGNGGVGQSLLGGWDGYHNVAVPNGGFPFLGTYTLGTVQNPTHPVMAGVTTFSTGSWGYYSTGGLSAQGVSVASYSTGGALIGEHFAEPNIMWLNFFPFSTNHSNYGWDTGTDGGLILSNAVAHCGPQGPPPPTLDITGSCGSMGTATLTNMTPNSLVYLGWSTTQAAWTVPNGPCAGLVLDVVNPNRIIIGNADASGTYTFSAGIPLSACGNVFVIGVDVASCTATNTWAM